MCSNYEGTSDIAHYFTDLLAPGIGVVAAPKVNLFYSGERFTVDALLWKWNPQTGRWDGVGDKRNAAYGFTTYYGPIGVEATIGDFYNSLVFDHVDHGYYQISYVVQWYGTDNTTTIAWKHFPVTGYSYNGRVLSTPYCKV